MNNYITIPIITVTISALGYITYKACEAAKNYYVMYRIRKMQEDILNQFMNGHALTKKDIDILGRRPIDFCPMCKKIKD